MSEKAKNTNLKRYKHPSVHSSICTIAKIWRQPQCPSTDECMKKIRYTHKDTHTVRYYSTVGDTELFAICNNMDELRGDYAK